MRKNDNRTIWTLCLGLVAIAAVASASPAWAARYKPVEVITTAVCNNNCKCPNGYIAREKRPCSVTSSTSSCEMLVDAGPEDGQIPPHRPRGFQCCVCIEEVKCAAPTSTPTRVPTPTPTPQPPDGGGAPSQPSGKPAPLMIYRPETGTWWLEPKFGCLPYMSSSRHPGACTAPWGNTGDLPVATDFDGDNRTDLAVFRPSEAMWWLRPSWRCPEGTVDYGDYCIKKWGWDGDIPVPADYDGDGRDSIAVWHPSDATWYIMKSNGSCPHGTKNVGWGCTKQWGFSSDLPVPADYDGDGTDDIAIWRPNEGKWYVAALPSGCPRGMLDLGWGCTASWGVDGDVPVPGDYDGDGKADRAIWRSNGDWWVSPSSGKCPSHVRSVSGGCRQRWGISGDEPVVDDFDQDGKVDLMIWRSSNGEWWLWPSSRRCPSNMKTIGGGCVKSWGEPGDHPARPDGSGFLH